MLFFDPLLAFLLWFKNFGNMGHRHYSRKLYDFFTNQPLPVLFCTGHHYSKKLYGDLEPSFQRPIHSCKFVGGTGFHRPREVASTPGRWLYGTQIGKECFRVEVTSKQKRGDGVSHCFFLGASKDENFDFVPGCLVG